MYLRYSASCTIDIDLAGSGGTHDQSRSLPKYPSCRYCQRWKQKFSRLVERIRVLEDALALESEARSGSGSHPLLTDELLAIKHSLTEDESESNGEEERSDELLGAFGTLSIDESKTMRYLGPAASEVRSPLTIGCCK